jgi:hypothetical protein
MIIITNAKRGRSKVKRDVSIRDFYILYKERELKKNRNPKEYKLYANIIKDANKLIIDKIVKENEIVRLPYKLGLLGITKYNVNFDETKKNKWLIDYQKSKEHGQIVYYDQPFRYKYRWEKAKGSCIVKGKRWYRFQPSRYASRLIPQALRENSRLDYCTKLIY